MVHRSESELNLDNIVFEKRNKTYGAYEIRNIYNSYLIRSILIAAIVFSGALLAPKAYEYLFPEEEIKEEEFKIQEITLEEPPPIDPKTPPPPPPPKLQIALPEPPKVASREFLPPKIMDDKKVIEEKDPPTTEELKDANPGEKTEEGVDASLNEHIDTGPVNSEVGDAAEAPLVFVSKPSQFIGNYMKFLTQNLKYPNQALKKEIQGKVSLKFVVDKNGNMSQITIVKGLGYGCDEEAIRVVKLMDKKWSVAENNGVPVTAWKHLEIQFKMQFDEE